MLFSVFLCVFSVSDRPARPYADSSSSYFGGLHAPGPKKRGHDGPLHPLQVWIPDVRFAQTSDHMVAAIFCEVKAFPAFSGVKAPVCKLRSVPVAAIFPAHDQHRSHLAVTRRRTRRARAVEYVHDER